MSDIAIKVEGLSKQYRIGMKQERYKTLRDTLTDMAATPFRAIRSAVRHANGGTHGAGRNNGMIWALKDVSFDVKRGEVVGIIGRNGAGKSTLLKILSQITEPTGGQAIIHGRVGSLLEVGTGFHPELTGRENIFLNGAILGMRHDEIERKFDEIVDFAEVEKFIDTPVKHYSSGMYLRLAFSVAAHLEPEILLVDEVLAVGDMAFQKKCLGKMEDVATQGRTVLFVSHNLGAVKELCQTCVVLSSGRVEYHGPVLQGLVHYTKSIRTNPDTEAHEDSNAWQRVYIDGGSIDQLGRISNDSRFTVSAILSLGKSLSKARFYCIVADSNGNGIIHHVIHSDSISPGGLAVGRYHIAVEFPALWLMPDAYSLSFKMIGYTKNGVEQRHISESLILNVTDITGQSQGKVRAVIIPQLRWSVKSAQPCLY